MSFDFDLIVIGGGSGGMACAKQAANLGAKVALFDFVKPSPQGSTWGLGGTCVNVGCVPKKIMHFASLLGHSLHDASTLGWKMNPHAVHDWEKLVEEVSNHVHMLNFRYRAALQSKKVNYINGLASFVDSHTIRYRLKNSADEKTLTANFIVIAVGGRPMIPLDCVGAMEHGISSDDLFSLDRSPGKTLCVGSSYISLECAGFLTAFGYDVTVAVRSVLLRGFDRQCSEKVGALMEDTGTRFLRGAVPRQIRKLPSGKLEVTFTEGFPPEEFDTVLFATGRRADVGGLGLLAAGPIQVDESTGKIIVGPDEQTSVSNIFCVGDSAFGRPELTPVAVRAGELLARRLFGGGHQHSLMDYSLVPTTVFTPFEFGSVGMSEEAAIARFGEDDVEVYLSEFTTLELSSVHRTKHPKHGEDEDLGHTCLSKIVCLKSEGERVLGVHFVGPNAGEILQGFALSLKLGARKSDLDSVVGIHPTDAESLVGLTVSKRSGLSFSSEGCGGGTCG